MSDSYMYSNASRFMGNLTGRQQPNQHGRYGQSLELNKTTRYQQFHEMKGEMPIDVLELFKANDVAFLKAPDKNNCRPLDPVTTTCPDLNSMFDIPNENLMEAEKKETREERRTRIAHQRKEKHEEEKKEKLAKWNPFEDPNIQSEPDRTLIVARLSYKTDEKTLKYEFEKYGIIKSVRVIRDEEGKSRGYGFVEFDAREDFIAAYKNATHRKIDGSRIVVDYERGRTLLKWRPRHLGGGRGYLRLTREEVENMERTERKKRKHRRDERSRSRSKHRKHDDKKRDRRSPDRKEKKDKKERRDRRDRDDRW